MLTKAMRKYVTSKDKSGYTKNKQSTYNSRVEADIVQALRDLTFLAERLPDKQVERVFNAKTLTPFFQALFKLEIKTDGGDHKDWLQKKEEMKMKRDRLLKIAGAALRTIGDIRFARALLDKLLLPYLQDFPYSRNFEFIITQATR